ncbi:DNA topoisomerase [Trifolium repens]|nr:DNA topoisomerase [Trifolium repens]
MAVESSDGPVTFKRSSASRSNQLHSASGSNDGDGQSNRKTSDVPSLNGQSSSSPNRKVVPSAKASAMESSVGVSKASNLKTDTKNSPSANSKFPSLGNKKESLLEKKIPIHDDSEDEEDKMSLSAIKMKMNHDNHKKATPNAQKKSYEDSDDDDIPLSARLPHNTNLGESSSNYDKQEKTSTLSVKRPLDEIGSLHSSGKKSKLSDPGSSINAKQILVKSDAKVEEEEDDDDDDILISRKMNKVVKLVDKPSSSKKSKIVTKVNKGAAPSSKKKEKFKKSGNESEDSKSSKLELNSGDGQKKWTTLVHNGIRADLSQYDVVRGRTKRKLVGM